MEEWDETMEKDDALDNEVAEHAEQILKKLVMEEKHRKLSAAAAVFEMEEDETAANGEAVPVTEETPEINGQPIRDQNRNEAVTSSEQMAPTVLRSTERRDEDFDRVSTNSNVSQNWYFNGNSDRKL